MSKRVTIKQEIVKSRNGARQHASFYTTDSTFPMRGDDFLRETSKLRVSPSHTSSY
jgi:hypothetical protein